VSVSERATEGYAADVVFYFFELCHNFSSFTASGASLQLMAGYFTGAVITASGVYADEPDELVALTR
jgi:hypothetical protein